MKSNFRRPWAATVLCVYLIFLGVPENCISALITNLNQLVTTNDQDKQEEKVEEQNVL
jgi:hypothetical protein